MNLQHSLPEEIGPEEIGPEEIEPENIGPEEIGFERSDRALVLPAQCGTAIAAKLQGALMAAVADEAPPVIDAGAVESVGQAVLQLLLAARVARPDLRFAPISPPFAERVLRCGLGPALGVGELAA